MKKESSGDIYQEMTTDNRKRQIRTIVIAILVCVVFYFLKARGSSVTEFKVMDNGLRFMAGNEACERAVLYDEITDIEYIENFDAGEALGDSIKADKMKYTPMKNAEYGEYAYYSYEKCTSAVVVHTTSGVVAFSYGSDADTKASAEALTKQWKNVTQGG